MRTNIPRVFHYWTSIYNKIIPISKNKTGELQITFANNLLTGIHIYKNIHGDHTPFSLEISILGATLLATAYDHRHWDFERDKYEEWEH